MILIKFKIRISQLIAKISLKQRSLTKLDTVWEDVIKSSIIFYQKTLKYFNGLQNRNFSVLWLKWTQTLEINQIRHFPWDIFKSDTMSLLSKNIKVFQWLSKSKFLSFMTKVNPNNGNETKSDIFPWDIFKSDIIFHWW